MSAGGLAVMADRVSAKTAGPGGRLDFFPTPPWGTRALTKILLPTMWPKPNLAESVAWDPCAGMGHMADVLAEDFKKVYASDVWDYRFDYNAGVGSFVGLDALPVPRGGVDWVIANPPFALAAEFVERAVEVARVGAAMLLRTQFVETDERYDLFKRNPFEFMAPFAGRLAMTENRWEPTASTATSYAWFVWDLRPPRQGGMFVSIIPPGSRRLLTRSDDVARFAGRKLGANAATTRRKREREMKLLRKLIEKHGVPK